MAQSRQPEDLDIEGLKRLSRGRLAQAIASIPHPLAIWDAEHRLLATNPAYDGLLSEIFPQRSPDTPLHVLGRAIIPKLIFENEGELNAFLAQRARRRFSGDDDYDVTLVGNRTLHVASRRTPHGDTVSIAFEADGQLDDAAPPTWAGSSNEASKRGLSLELAHLLRTPLNAMMGFAQLLGRQGSDPLTERQRVMVNRILEAGSRLVQVIHDNEIVPVQSSGLPDNALALDAEPPSKSRTLLYIEDDPASVALLEALFADDPRIELKPAGTAEEGVELARTCDPDVILMDINLSGTSGADGLRALRASDASRRIPVIALTAAPLQESTEHSEFDFHLSKPVVLEELEAVLRAVLVLT